MAAAGLVVIVRGGLGLKFVLNVRVNGENVGYVESEQVFEKRPRGCAVAYQHRQAYAAKFRLGHHRLQTGTSTRPYSLSIGNQTMTESEIANAILRTASDEIINGTAVYVDDQLLYVTTEGDHLHLSGKHQGPF